MTKDKFTILVDSREREPYIFKKYEYPILKASMPTGDYSIGGYINDCAIERKSFADFVQSITKGRDRFERELDRGSEMTFFAVVIEADCRNLYSKRLYSKINRGVIFHTATKWMVKYNIPIIWASTRGKGEKTVVSLLEAFHKYNILGEK